MDSSALQRLAVRILSSGTQCWYTLLSTRTAAWPLGVSLPPMRTWQHSWSACHRDTLLSKRLDRVLRIRQNPEHTLAKTRKTILRIIHLPLAPSDSSASPQQSGEEVKDVWSLRLVFPGLTLSGLSRSFIAVPSARNSGLLRISKLIDGLEQFLLNTCREAWSQIGYGLLSKIHVEMRMRFQLHTIHALLLTFSMASAVFTGTVDFSTTILEDFETAAIIRAAPSQ